MGERVETTGVVTRLVANGFYLQDLVGDGDDATSDGLFVLTRDEPAVAVGEAVSVEGAVAEYETSGGASSLTQLTEPSVTVTSSGNALPGPVEITARASDARLEALEGVRVEVVSGGGDPLTVTETFNLDRFGEVAVSEGRKVQPTQIFNPATEQAAIQALAADNAENRLVLDDGDFTQNPDAYLLVPDRNPTDANAFLDPADPITEDGPTLRLGAEFAQNLVGVLDGRFGEYRVQLDATPEIDSATNAGARPEAPEAVGGDLKVASLNALNCFTTLDQRGAASAEDLERQTAKLVEAVELLDADVIALQEIENNGFGEESAIARLTAEINAEFGAGAYEYVDFSGRPGRTG